MLSVPPASQTPSFGSFRGTIRLISHCPLCHAFYQPTAAKLVAEHEDRHLVHLECGSCGGAIIAVVIANTLGIQSVGLVTDLSRDDLLRLQSGTAVGPNDVIDLHEYLDQNRNFLNL